MIAAKASVSVAAAPSRRSRILTLSADQNFRQGPPRPSVVLQPGLRALTPGEERYTVPGGGIIAVPIGAGDLVRVVNVEGMQLCELVAADREGKLKPLTATMPPKARTRSRT